MKSTQRKCLIASAVTHGLLLVMLLVGSAFVPSKRPLDEGISIQLIDIPDILVDEPNVVGGGNPRAGLPNVDPAPLTQAPTLPAPAPAPAPTPKPEPQQPAPKTEQAPPPEPEPAKTEKPAEPAPAPKPNPFNFAEAKTRPAADSAPKPAEKKPSFDISKAQHKVIKPSPSRTSPNSSSSSSGESETSAAAARGAQIASAAGAALANLSKGLSTGVGEIGIPGPGGAAYASYGLALRKIYYDAWIPPTAAGDREPVVQVEVVISRDGTVLSARILKRSGKRELDRSVQETLNRVKKVREFPSGSTDQKRTFQIHFDLSNRQNYG